MARLASQGALIAGAGLLLVNTAFAQQPTGADVIAGFAVINVSPTVMDVNAASARTIINWDQFSIGAGNTANFNLPDANSAILNRVTSVDMPSVINGALNSNGQVHLVNPSGIMVGATGIVNTNAFVASTFDIANSDFLNRGALTFSNNGSNAAIVNNGSINTGAGGAHLIANNIANSGVITSVGGNITMSGGGEVTLSNGVNYVQPTLETLASGISPTAGLIQNTGTVRATGAATSGGEVYLVNPNGKILHDGTIAASAVGSQGGRIQLEADEITLTANSLIDASGSHGGGKVLVGGDWQGRGDMTQATTVTMEAGAVIDASATEQGDGGKIVLWSDIHNFDSVTTAFGTLIARGGELFGNGGDIETSGHTIDTSGITVDAGASNGQGGLWLIDPYNYVIDAVAASNIVGTLNTGTSVEVTTTSNNASHGSSGNSSDNGDITVTGDIITGAMSGDAALTLKAARHIRIDGSTGIDATQNGNTAKLNVKLWADTDNSGDGINSITSAGIKTNGGSLTVGNGDTANIGGTTVKVGGDLYISGSTAQTLDTDGGEITINGETIVANSVGGVTFDSGGGDIVFGGLLNSGNQYTYVDGPDGQANSWDWARTNAKNGTAGGSAVGDSYMVTITSRLENAISGIAADYRGAWIGAYRDAATSDWYWADGPEGGQHFFTQAGAGGSPGSGWYSNFGAGEPNGTGTGGETRGQFFGNQGQWNDLGPSTTFDASQASQYSVLGYVRETNLAPTAVTVNAGTGAVTMEGAVGGGKALASLDVTGGAGIFVNGGVVRTEGLQTFNSPVILGAHTDFSTIQNDIIFNSTVDSDSSANKWDLTTTITPSSTYYWVDWTNWDEPTKTATGTITVGGDVITVTYHNPQGIFGSQTSGGTDYWTGYIGAAFSGESPYVSSNVANGPTGSDIIQLEHAGLQTLTFSESVENLAFSIVSMNGNGYGFDQDFTIESHSGLNGAGPGYYGSGNFTKAVVGNTFQLNDGGVNGASVGGNSEPHGTIRFGNAFSSLTWNSLSDELWNGFTVGVSGTSDTAGKVHFNGLVGNTAEIGAITVNGRLQTTANIAAASSFDVTGLANLGGSITTSGDQTFGSAITIASDLTLETTDNGNVTAISTIDGAHDLTITTDGTGDVTLSKAAGGTDALTGLTITADQFSADGIAVAASSEIKLTTAGASEVTGVISGSDATLAKEGAGTLTLSGTNTYSGGTTISEGAISIAADANLGAAPGSATASHLKIDGGTLIVTDDMTLSSNRGIEFGSDDATIDVSSGKTFQYGGIVDGVGDLTKTSAGTLRLSGANTFDGATRISGGILEANNQTALGDNDSAVTLDDVAGASLNLLSDLEIGSLTGGGSNGGNVALGTSLLTTGANNTSTTFAGVISGTGDLEKTGSGDFTLTQNNTLTGAITIDEGGLILENNAPTFATSGIDGPGSLTIQSTGDSFTSAFSTSTVPFGSTTALGGLTIGKTTNTSDVTIGGNVTVNGGLNIYGDDINVNADINTTGGAAIGDVLLKGATNITQAAGVDITTAGGDVTFWADSDDSNSGYIALGNTASVVTGGGNIVMGGGADSGSDGIPDGDAIGQAQLTESGGPFHSGVSLHNATLNAQNGGSLDATAGNITINGTSNYTGGNRAVGVMLFGTKLTGDVIDVTGSVIDTSGTTTRYGISANGGTTPNNTNIQSFGGITLTGNAATPADQYSIRYGTNHDMSVVDGDITINSNGQLQYLSNQTLTLADTRSLIFNSAYDAEWRNVIAGQGGLIKQGTGTLTLNEVNTFSGTTQISGGTLEHAKANALNDATTVTIASGATWDLAGFSDTVASINGAGNIALGSGTLTAFGDNSSETLSGVISGTGNFVKQGTGTLTLTGTNTYTGSTTVAGALEILHDSPNLTSSGYTGTGEVTIESVGSAFTSAVDTTGTTFGGSLSGLTIGKSTNTADITIGSTASIDGDINLTGGNIAINAGLTSQNTNTINLNATGTIADGGSGFVDTDKLLISTDGATTLDSTGNKIGTFASDGTSLTLVEANGMTIGTVGSINGINATGTVDVKTLAGDLTVSQDVVTTDASASAIVLNAGKSTAAGTTTGGDIIISGSPAITTGSGGRATLFTGSIDDSTGLANLVGSGSGKFRYNSDESTTNYTLALGTGIHGIYREQPTVTVAADDKSITYGDAVLTWTFDVGGAINGDSTVQIFNSGIGMTVGGATSSSGNYTAGNHTLTAVPGTSQLGYGVGTLTDGTLAVAAKSINTSLVINDRIYDGTTGATFTASGNGIITGDSVSIGGTAAFVDKDSGTDKNVNITGLNITGTDAANYSLNSTTGSSTADITAKSVVISGLVANDRVYDGTTAATIDHSGVTFTGMITGDNLTAADTIGVFADKNVGTGKTVTLSGTTYGGTDVGNYSFTDQTSTTADITPASIIISGLSADHRQYDGTTVAAIDHSGVTFTGIVTGDDLTASSTAGAFADKNVGDGKTVTLTGTVYGGTDAGNYSFTDQATTTANISKKNLIIGGLVTNDRVYDGTIIATVNSSGVTFGGLVSGDDVTLDSVEGRFADKIVGTDKVVFLSAADTGGVDEGNYRIFYNALTRADITPKSINISGLQAGSRIYDGSTSATVDHSGVTFGGIISGDELTASNTIGIFDNKNAGAGQTVTLSGTTYGGTDVGNYSFTDQTTTTADITQKSINISGLIAEDRVYDGTSVATVDHSGVTFNGIVLGDSLTVADTIGAFDNKNVGSGKAVTLSGTTYGGTDVGNYSITDQGAATADITAKSIIVGGITAADRVYDGTTTTTVDHSGVTFSGMITGDDLTAGATTGVFDNKNVGTGKAVTLAGTTYGGTDVGNYTFTDQTSTTADVTAKSITVSGLLANDRIYDGTTVATIDHSGVTFNGIIAGDELTAANTVGAFADKNVGSAKAVILSGTTYGGTDIGNYSFTDQATTTADVSVKTIVVNGITADSRVYDGTTTATVDLSGVAFNGIVSGDNLTASGTTGTFADKNVGTGKTVTLAGTTYGGADVGNYSFTDQASTTADVTAKSVTVSGLLADNRIYDGTTVATVDHGGVTFNGIVSGDNLTASNTTGAFADKNAGTSKTVTLGGTTYGGTDVGNYSFTDQATTTADISQKSITVSGITAADKVYDGSTLATIDLSGITFNNMVSGDSLTASGTIGVFIDKNVDSGKTVNLSGTTYGGTDLGNYTIVDQVTALADISRLSSVTWIGGTSRDWSNAANWAAGAIPDLANVAAVIIPDGVTPTFDNSVAGPVDIDSLNGGNLQMDGGTLNVANDATLDDYTQNGGTFNVGGKFLFDQATINGGILDVIGDLCGGLFIQNGGSVATGGDFEVIDFEQHGGTLDITNNFKVTNSFQQTNDGTITVDGDVDITHTTGDLTVLNLYGTNVGLNSTNGGVHLGDVTSTGTLDVTAGNGDIDQLPGTNLTAGGESTFTATGDITLTNPDNDFVGPVNANGNNVAITDGHGGLVLGDITTGGTFDAISTDGPITQSPTGELTINGPATFTATQGGSTADIILNGLNNDFRGPVSADGHNIELFDAHGGLLLDNIMATGDFVAVSNDGPITQTSDGGIEVLGITTVAATKNGEPADINLTNPSNNFAGLVNASGRKVDIDDADNEIQFGEFKATDKDDLLMQESSAAVRDTNTRYTTDETSSGTGILNVVQRYGQEWMTRLVQWLGRTDATSPPALTEQNVQSMSGEVHIVDEENSKLSQNPGNTVFQ